MVKRVKVIVWMMAISCILCACSKGKETVAPEPSMSQIRQICELATLECYYHNVAKSVKTKGTGWGHWGEEDRKFWIEYTGIARIGIDMSRVQMEVNDDVITVSVPEAEILSIEVQEDTLNEDSYYIEGESDKNRITADDQTKAIADAQQTMEKTVKENKSLLINARERAESLIENYIVQLGKTCGKEYTVEFTDIDTNSELGNETQQEKE